MSIEKARTLGESVDILRKDLEGIAADVKELYELDEDNYQIGKNLRKAIDEANNRINHVSRALSRSSRRTFGGFLIGGGVLYLTFKGIAAMFDKYDSRLKALEKSDKAEETEESDG